MEGKPMSLWLVIATCLFLSSMCSGRGFSSHLKTMVEDGGYTSHIIGPDGYCAQVRDTDYHNRCPIILQPCESDLMTQIWIFGSDGTIRSNGMCLAASGYDISAYIMIYQCPSPVTNRTLWTQTYDGNIVNQEMGRVITAFSATIGSELTLDTNVYAYLQAWVAKDESDPYSVRIVGYNGVCVQVSSRNDISAAQCDSESQAQRWLAYVDGTLRHPPNTGRCLSYDSVDKPKVVTMSCGSQSRWFYTGKRTILNQRDNLVFDVVDSTSALKEIFAYPPTGKPSQEWQIVPF